MESMARPRASLAAVARTVSMGVAVAVMVTALDMRAVAILGRKAEEEARRHAIPIA